MNIEEMRKKMREHFDSFTPEAFCDMLEEKFGFKRVENVPTEIPMLSLSNSDFAGLFSANLNYAKNTSLLPGGFVPSDDYNNEAA